MHAVCNLIVVFHFKGFLLEIYCLCFPVCSVRVVHLHKGTSGLGFSIVGGKGSPKGNLPIIIKFVSPDSMAAKEGQLKAKDIILSVNGISFENVSHDFAVNMLKQLGGNISLEVCCS